MTMHRPTGRSYAGLELLLAQVSPLDFPVGTLAIYDAALLPPALAGGGFSHGTYLAWTAPHADMIAGVADEGRRSVIVIDAAAIVRQAAALGWSPAAALYGSVLHEAAHLATFPAPQTLPRVADQLVVQAQAEVGAITAGGGVQVTYQPANVVDIYHGPGFGRALAHLLARAERLGIAHEGAWLGHPPLHLIREFVEDSFETFWAGSIRDLLAGPMPPVFPLLFPN
ncbi:MAG: hypothetical protein AB7O59_01000 [Pirellulales bacterium]